MSEASPTAPFPQAEPPRPPARARAALLKRLADVVCLPASRVNAFERAMTADLLVEMLRDAVVEEREKVARRLANLVEMPGTLVRLLLRDCSWGCDSCGERAAAAAAVADSQVAFCAGSRLGARGSWLMARGSALVARGSALAALLARVAAVRDVLRGGAEPSTGGVSSLCSGVAAAQDALPD